MPNAVLYAGIAAATIFCSLGLAMHESPAIREPSSFPPLMLYALCSMQFKTAIKTQQATVWMVSVLLTAVLPWTADVTSLKLFKWRFSLRNKYWKYYKSFRSSTHIIVNSLPIHSYIQLSFQQTYFEYLSMHQAVLGGTVNSTLDNTDIISDLWSSPCTGER